MAHPRNNTFSFLIEGLTHADKPHKFPEIAAMVNLPKKTIANTFDSISSYDAEHIGAQLKNKNEKDHKKQFYCVFIWILSTKEVVR